MAQIGQFTRTQSGYSGRVRTLNLDIELTFVPANAGDVENAPDYRIHLGDGDEAEIGPEVGAAWKHTGERAGAFVSIVFDDPTFVQPIRARLFQSDDEGRDWGLHWSRPKKRDGED
jgi:uncharacterized protein (DUF736 family)